MTQWKYYNHALIPDQAPHLPVDESKIKDGSAFNAKIGGVPMLARWTEGWDLPQETHFWYCIKNTPFDYNVLSKKAKYEVRKAKKNFTVKRISPQEYIQALYEVQNKAFAAWPKKYRPSHETLDHFQQAVSRWPATTLVYGAFLKDTTKLVAYALVNKTDTHADFYVLRAVPIYEKLAVNAAVVCGILEDLLPNFNQSFYINDGTRNIRHQTHFQDYLEKYFGFHKAYCKLHIKYHPKVGKLIKMLYPFRSIFRKLDSIGKIHQLNAVLKMEEICRADKEVKCTD